MSTYLRKAGDDIMVIQLERHVGQLIGFGRDDDKINKKAEDISNTIEEAAKKQSLESRAGVYE